jgi:PAS domain S-box-containing protein
VERWFIGRVTRVPGEGVPRVIVAHEDITARRRSEEELRESEARYRLLAENVSDVVFQGREGGLTWVSPSVTALSGWRPEELLEQPLEAFVHPEDAARLAALREGGSPADRGRAEVRMRFADGAYHWLSVALSLVADAGGRQTVIGSVRDVQPEVEAREALAESERHYRALSESSPDYIFVLGRDLRVRYVNPTSANAFRRSSEEIVGLALADLFDAETAAGMSAGLHVVFEAGTPRHTETEWRGSSRSRTRTERWLRSSESPATSRT